MKSIGFGQDFNSFIYCERVDDQATQNVSPFVRVLQSQMNSFQNNVASKFNTGPWIIPHIRNLCNRILVYFVRHAALVRPLSESGKLKLVADMAQVEFAIAPLQPSKDMASYRALRAFRPFIFKETEKILESPEGQLLLPSTFLHHLCSRAPDTLQQPYVIKGWSLLQYSDWLDHHSEAEVVGLIRQTLDNYAKYVNSKGEKQYTPVYPIMLHYISKFSETK